MTDAKSSDRMEQLSKEVGATVAGAPSEAVPPAVEARILEGIRKIAAEPLAVAAPTRRPRRWGVFGGFAAAAVAAAVAVVVTRGPQPRTAEPGDGQAWDGSWLQNLQGDGLRGRQPLRASDPLDIQAFLSGLAAAAERSGRAEVAETAKAVKARLGAGAVEEAVDVPSCAEERQRRVFRARDEVTVAVLLRFRRDAIDVVLYPAAGSPVAARVTFEGARVTDLPPIPPREAEELLAHPACEAR